MQQTIFEETKVLCQQLGIVPTKSKGQNFLISQEILEQIVAAADLNKEDAVLEIGPGLGILTEELVKKAGTVVAVELDKKLFNFLSEKFGKEKKLELVEGDIISLFDDVARILFKGKNYKVIANLPYQITSHILRLMLESDKPPSEMVLMVQKEVGERICARPGKMSILSVMVQYYSQPMIVAVVGRDNFWPKPEVDSVVMHIKSRKQENKKTLNQEIKKSRNQENKKSKKQEEEFFKLVRVGFSGKRKMLKNNLRNVFAEEEVVRVMQTLALDPKVRAEDLGVEEWIKLYEKLGW